MRLCWHWTLQVKANGGREAFQEQRAAQIMLLGQSLLPNFCGVSLGLNFTEGRKQEKEQHLSSYLMAPFSSLTL